MPAKDVIAKGKVAGVALSAAHIYAIRSDAKKRKGGRAKSTSHAASHASHTVGNHKAEDLLKAVASELGLSRAMEILQGEHDRVHRILGG
jgi:hypothetical protein